MAGIASRVPRIVTQGRQSIPIIGANEIPRIQFSSGSARALEQFSRDMFSVSDGFQDQLDDQAEAESTVEGALAGATGDFEQQDYGTIRGRAFNKAAIETFVTTMETNSILKLQELTARFGSDPAQLQAEIEGWSAGAAGEVEKVYAPAGAAFRQRTALRAAPAIEAAKDARFKLTRDQADAQLIENEIALKAEITNLAGDLFSENPARSSAAAMAVGAFQSEYLKIFDAQDPTTGRPLYSAEERAKAKAGFYEEVMETAAIGWFEGQDDKAGAYVKFTEGDFTINLETPGADPAKVIEAQPDVAGIRKQPIQPQLKTQLATAAAQLGPNVSVRVHSGGQPTAAEVAAARREGRTLTRTGSNRHDHGNAADVTLMVDGKIVTPSQNRALYLQFAEAAAASGVPGIGIGESFIHVGGGSQTAWGYGPNGGKGEYLPGDFAQAIDRGRKGPKLTGAPVKQSIDVRQALGPDAMGRIEAEMRARISFRNTLADRQIAQEEKILKQGQDANRAELAIQLYGAGTKDPETGETIQPLTREAIITADRRGFIDDATTEALLKALTVEKPDRSDQATYRDALARVYAGENIYQFVLSNSDKLSPSDASELLAKNQSLVVMGEGGMSKEEQFHFDNLQDYLTPDSLMAKIDEGAEDRKYLALDEFRGRTADGENPREVAADIRDRARVTMQDVTNTAIDRLIMPRFAVRVQGTGRRIDPVETGRQLWEAHKAGRITDQVFAEQKRLLQSWDNYQKAADQAGVAQ